MKKGADVAANALRVGKDEVKSIDDSTYPDVKDINSAKSEFGAKNWKEVDGGFLGMGGDGKTPIFVKDNGDRKPSLWMKS